MFPEMEDGYHLGTEDGWLASFKTNGECKNYLTALLNGRTILGDDYTGADFVVYKGRQQLTLDIRHEVSIGGY